MIDVMFILGVSEALEPQNQEVITRYLKDPRVNVIKWAYLFQDFGTWGDYFNIKTPEPQVHEAISWFHDLGFKVGFYVDVAECTTSILANLKLETSVLELRWVDQPGWKASRMNLSPRLRWYKYLCTGMLKLLEKWPIDGFNIDRADVAGHFGEVNILTILQTRHLCQLLDEVKEKAGYRLFYVSNSMWPWQTNVARRSYFLGSDGIPAYDPDITSERLQEQIARYRDLGQFTEFKKAYIAPTDGSDRPGNPDENRVLQWKNILKTHSFTFFDVRSFKDIPEIVSSVQ